MHNAPAVSFPVGRSRFHVRILFVVSFLGVLAALAWATQAQAPDWRQCVMLAGSLLTGLHACWQWRHAPTGQVSWSGSSWTWAAANGTVSVQLVVVADVQSAMLLMLDAGRGVRGLWMWVERDASPARWLALRRAVYQHPRVDQDPLRGGSQVGGSKA